MTISEHLKFSVLSAPVAAIDRRSLSQAWYSALYGAGRESHGSCAPPDGLQLPRPVRTPVAAQRFAPPASASDARTIPGARKSGTVRFLPHDRRCARSPLARKIERAFLRPHARVRTATFAFEGPGGRVHVSLRKHGASSRLVAICAREHAGRVAAALAQARYALAQRGIALETMLQEYPS